MRNLCSYFRSNLTIAVFLTLLTFITYINILPNQLFYDDEELIYQNAYVQNLSFFPKYFTENMIAGAGKASNMYRPILLTSFAIDYAIWGNNPVGFHLSSILLHAINSMLIFILIKNLFVNRSIALLTSIFFIIHPVQTETIAYASGRTDPLFSFFVLLSVLASLSFLNHQKVIMYKLIATIVFFILALLSKETAIILPLLILLTALIKFEKQKSIKNKFILILIPFFIIDVIYVLLRLTVLNFANTLNFYQLSNIYSQNILIRLYTFSRVFFEYAKIILFPHNLIFARSVDYITSPFSIWVIIFFFTIASFLLFLIKNRWKNKAVVFSFFWFFITILPVSGIIPINNIVAEHYLYLPSLAFFLLFSYFFYILWQKCKLVQLRTLIISLLMIIFTSLIFRTILRNVDWKDPVTFYTKSLSQSPWHVPMHHNLAMAYANQGKFETAIKEYQNLISWADIYPQTHHNLANVYKIIGQYQEAEEEYLKALKMDHKFFFSLYGLADLYQKTGETKKLEEVTEKIKALSQ